MAMTLKNKTIENLIIMQEKINVDITKAEERLKKLKGKQSNITEALKMKQMLKQGEAYRDLTLKLTENNIGEDIFTIIENLCNEAKSGKKVQIGNLLVDNNDSKEVLGEPPYGGYKNET